MTEPTIINKLLLACFIVIVVCLCMSAIGNAQAPAEEQGQAVQDELMRVFLSEAGWVARRTHFAMGAILKRSARALNVDLMDVIADRVWKHSRALQTRPWIAHLTASCDELSGFPRPWANYAQRCRYLEQTAYAVLYGRAWNPCSKTRPTGWRSYGGPLARAIANGFEQVDCAGNRVAFVRAKT